MFWLYPGVVVSAQWFLHALILLRSLSHLFVHVIRANTWISGRWFACNVVSLHLATIIFFMSLSTVKMHTAARSLKVGRRVPAVVGWGAAPLFLFHYCSPHLQCLTWSSELPHCSWVFSFEIDCVSQVEVHYLSACKVFANPFLYERFHSLT